MYFQSFLYLPLAALRLGERLFLPSKRDERLFLFPRNQKTKSRARSLARWGKSRGASGIFARFRGPARPLLLRETSTKRHGTARHGTRNQESETSHVAGDLEASGDVGIQRRCGLRRTDERFGASASPNSKIRSSKLSLSRAGSANRSCSRSWVADLDSGSGSGSASGILGRRSASDRDRASGRDRPSVASAFGAGFGLRSESQS